MTSWTFFEDRTSCIVQFSAAVSRRSGRDEGHQRALCDLRPPPSQPERETGFAPDFCDLSETRVLHSCQGRLPLAVVQQQCKPPPQTAARTRHTADSGAGTAGLWAAMGLMNPAWPGPVVSRRSAPLHAGAQWRMVARRGNGWILGCHAPCPMPHHAACQPCSGDERCRGRARGAARLSPPRPLTA